MPKRISIVQHHELDELETRYRQSKDSVERSQYQIVWLLKSGKKTEEVSEVTGYSLRWIRVVSPGVNNERRDREAKLKLYSLKGVKEYWIADWRSRQVEVYRREAAQLKLMVTLLPNDEITSPLLPGFRVPVQRFFS